MSLQLFLYFTFLSWTMEPMAFAARLSQPNCPENCGNGNITIPYPFGIGQQCSANSSFTVSCRNTTNPPAPFLTILDLEVLHISLDRSTITLNQPVSPMNCSSEQQELSLGQPLSGTPFNFSRLYSVLAVLGCNNVVTLRQNSTTTAGSCMAVCQDGVNSTETSCNGVNSTETSCNGVNCCQAILPAGLKEQQVFHRSINASNNNSSCGYTFIVAQNWLHNDYRNYTSLVDGLNPFNRSLVYAPVILEWDFDILCGFRSSFSINDTQCRCDPGYEGNPYLDIGCEDIDECSNSLLNHCQGDCINTNGSFTCVKSRTKMAVVGVLAGVGALVLFIGGGWWLYRVIRKRIKAKRKQKFFIRNGGLLLTEDGVDKSKLFTSKELERATDHFNMDRILGRGGQGTVYKGMLSDGRIVAVKKSQKVDEDDLEVFINEVVILSQINHRNIVKLIGCCLETEVPLLVYEFISNDTLFQHIHEPSEEFALSWETRLRIAAEVASALTYLHSAAAVPIYHRDVKSTNILLDDKYRVKVSDFGTSRSISLDQTHLTTKVIGTFGYLDPEYFQSSQFTEKSDVYSFGVVMVELLTGQKAISPIKAQGQGRSLATNFVDSMEENCLYDILDATVLKEGRKEEIEAIAQLARRCLYLHGKRRPTMKEVAVELEGIRMLKQRSTAQDNFGDTEHHSIIELSEFHDFESFSGSIRFDNVATSSSDTNPFLSGDL